MFKYFDSNGNEQIDEDEEKEFLDFFNGELDEEDESYLIGDFDKDNNGIVDLDDFCLEYSNLADFSQIALMQLVDSKVNLSEDTNHEEEKPAEPKVATEEDLEDKLDELD